LNLLNLLEGSRRDGLLAAVRQGIASNRLTGLLIGYAILAADCWRFCSSVCHDLARKARKPIAATEATPMSVGERSDRRDGDHYF